MTTTMRNRTSTASNPTLRKPSKLEDSYPPFQYFGVPLQSIIEKESKKVPRFLEKAIAYLENYSDEEGILRISGSLTEINNIREQVNQGKFIFAKKDPHAVASLLKSFFRELPEPLVPKNLNETANAILAFGEGPEVLEEMRNIVNELPPVNKSVLKLLVKFLMKLSAKSDVNKMTTNNLLRIMTITVNCVPGIISLPMANYSFFFKKNNDLRMSAMDFRKKQFADDNMESPTSIIYVRPNENETTTEEVKQQESFSIILEKEDPINEGTEEIEEPVEDQDSQFSDEDDSEATKTPTHNNNNKSIDMDVSDIKFKIENLKKTNTS